MLIKLAKLLGMSSIERREPGEVRMFFMLMLMSVFFIADTMLIAPNVDVICKEFGKVESDVGLVSTIFIFLGAAVALLWGYFADRYGRKHLLFATILLGEIPCFMTAYVDSYAELLVVRALTGLGIGGMLPLIFSMVGDLVTDKERPSAAAWFGLAEGMGMALGQMMAGHLGSTDFTFLGAEGWRAPFVLVALPNFLLAPLFMLICKEPPRGGGEDSIQAELDRGLEYKRRIKLSDYKVIFSRRTNLYFVLQGIPGTIGWGVIPYWTVMFFVTEKGVPKPTATNLSIIIGGAMILGGLVGGLVGSKLHQRDKRLVPILCGVTTIIGMAFFLLMFSLPMPDSSSPSSRPIARPSSSTSTRQRTGAP